MDLNLKNRKNRQNLPNVGPIAVVLVSLKSLHSPLSNGIIKTSLKNLQMIQFSKLNAHIFRRMLQFDLLFYTLLEKHLQNYKEAKRQLNHA